jgi:hypothetical protein
LFSSVMVFSSDTATDTSAGARVSSAEKSA